MVLCGAYLKNPIRKGAHFTVFDLILALLSLAAGLYIAIYYPSIAVRMNVPSLDRTIFGGLAILLTLEALRRSM